VSIRDKLLEIAGKTNFFDDPKTIATYATDYSLVPAGTANFVVKLKTAEQLQKVVELANKELVPVVPVSSKVHFTGSSIPKQGGIIADLTGMNKILEIDELNRRVRLEAGVTWNQIYTQLEKKGLRIMMPLLPHPDRSVLTDHLEREVITNTVYDYGEPMQSLEVVWPNGDLFRMGSASVPGYPNTPSKGANPSGPGMDFYRLVQGAQGTMGAVTWTNLKVQRKPTMDKVLACAVNDLNRVTDYLYRVLRMRIGQEVVILDANNLAAIVAEDMDNEYDKLRFSLPPYSLFMILSATANRPEEKIKYELDVLADVTGNEFPDIILTENLPGFPGLSQKMLSLLRKPWPVGETYWKNRVKGGCQSLFFITKPNLVPEFIDIAKSVAVGFDYPVADMGIYIQPIEHNRAAHLEFNFFYDPESVYEREQVAALYTDAAKVLLNEGAIFSRPYGTVAPMVYEKATGYTETLKRVKKIFDPNKIMNPGNLCF
jgi:hypothetical protein